MDFLCSCTDEIQISLRTLHNNKDQYKLYIFFFFLLDQCLQVRSEASMSKFQIKFTILYLFNYQSIWLAILSKQVMLEGPMKCQFIK